MALIEVLPGPPGLYEGWIACSVRGLTPSLIRERIDAYVESILARL